MLETCLENKIIYDFLKLYDQSYWKKLIPSLLEIAILNLYSSFNTLLFSEEDILNITNNLKLSQNESILYKTKIKPKKSIDFHNTNELRNTEREFNTDNIKGNRLSNSWEEQNYRNLKKVGNSIKNKYIIMDKKNYYNRSDNNLIKSYKQKERINYAISYDKNLKPETIERSTIERINNKDRGKKIIQIMTQEEYEEEYNKENQENMNNKNGELYKIYRINSFGMNNKENKDVNNIKNLKSLYNKIRKKKIIKNRNKKKNNLYHYKMNYSTQNNNKNNNRINKIFIKNITQNRRKSNENSYKKNKFEKVSNGINNQYIIKQNSINDIQNNISVNIAKSEKDNNYINKKNLIDKKKDNENNKNLNKKTNHQMKNQTTLNSDNERSSDLIGIEKKYEEKIDKLEKNILYTEKNLLKKIKEQKKTKDENNYNNYDSIKNNIYNNYVNKIKENIIDMGDYMKKKKYHKDNSKDINKLNRKYLKLEKRHIINGKNNNIYITTKGKNINDEKENKELNCNENNEEMYLSQMSNMTEKSKLIFKKAMSNFPSP